MLIAVSCAGCKEEVKGVKATKAVKVAEKDQKYVYEYKYFWLRQGMGVRADGYVAQGLHDSIRPHLGAGISRIEQAMGGMLKFTEVKDVANADFIVGAVALDETRILAFFDPSAKMICINMNASGNTNLGVTLAHELAHLVGLGHSSNPKSIMYWSTVNGMAIFTKEDRDAIKAILEGTSL